MPSVDLKSQIGKLVKLQGIDAEIYGLKAENNARPAEIKALEDSFEQKKEQLNNLEKASLDLQKQKKDKELELATKEEGIKKLQSQLYQLKTNAEYKAMLKQIDDTRADASVIEDSILELFDRTDKIKNDITLEKQRLQEEEKVVNGQKKVIQDRLAQIEERLSQLEAQRKQVAPDIDPGILSQYEKVLLNREGLAIAAVEDNSCKGCNMFVPPQMINLIKMYERMITCEVCNRILYIEDEFA